MRGVNNTTGIGLVEVYDLDRTVDSKLANISTRGLVQTGDNVMIGGFIVLGTDSQKVIVRAIGPSLPLAGKLADPTLDLYDGNGVLLASNDNWRDTQEAEIIATTIPPTNDAESAIVQTLAPVPLYTAIVRGKNGTTGSRPWWKFTLLHPDRHGHGAGSITATDFSLDGEFQLARLLDHFGCAQRLEAVPRLSNACFISSLRDKARQAQVLRKLCQTPRA